MAVKEIFRRMRPVQLYVVLALTALFFLTELVVSHVTHALTLLVDSYHMLCNLIALIGCIATVKYGDEEGLRSEVGCSKESLSGEGEEAVKDAGGGRRSKGTPRDSSKIGCMGSVSGCHGQPKGGSSEALPSPSGPLVSERRLRNTFGWARIDVLVLMIGTVFLASLCFSLVVEALQTLFHIGHSFGCLQDEMHHPIPVLCVGATGVLLNGLCYLLIGGYTFHQGSFLHVTSSGDVVLERAVSQERVGHRGPGVTTAAPPPSAPPMSRRRAAAMDCPQQQTTPTPAAVATSYLQAGISGTPPLRQGPREMLRDVAGCILVIVCSLTVYFTDANVAKYADPIISIVSAVLLFVLSYPYMKESGLILLQTIPDHINIESLRIRLCDAFAPTVVGVHDLHIWQLTPQRTYATAHVVFINSKEISSVMKEVTEFFHEHGINHVTIQPEFLRCRAISVPDVDCGDITTQTLLSDGGKKVGSSPFTITIESASRDGEGVICFLKCAGRGGSCRNLHCCDEAKGEPLALPHHHHQVSTTIGSQLTGSLDSEVTTWEREVAASDSPPVNPHWSSSSPSSVIARQRIPSKVDTVSCREEGSGDSLEKSTASMHDDQASGGRTDKCTQESSSASGVQEQHHKEEGLRRDEGRMSGGEGEQKAEDDEG